MQRRQFLAASTAGLMLARLAKARDMPRDVRITRAVAFTLPTRRSKVAGKNSHKEVHGDASRDRMLRLYTNRGMTALGNCRAGRDDVAELLGKDPFDFYKADPPQMAAPLAAGSMPLWDLAGKLLMAPVYELLGGVGPKRVKVYDGSIYFADLLPQYADRWQDRFRREIDMGRKLGHRAFKIKIGRGWKWMPRAEGDARDVEVVELIRRHGGSDLIIGVDANNGYDLAGAKAFLEKVGDLNIAFTEEMFPEQVQQCLEYKAFIARYGWKTLLADGETQRELTAYKPFIDAKAVDVFQGDMNRFGFEGILTEAAWAKEQGQLVAPHNWGSLVGYYMQLHVGRAITNFYRAEHDPLSTDVLIADGYSISGGSATVSEAPGFGLEIDEKKFAAEAKLQFDLKT